MVLHVSSEGIFSVLVLVELDHISSESELSIEYPGGDGYITCAHVLSSQSTIELVLEDQIFHQTDVERLIFQQWHDSNIRERISGVRTDHLINEERGVVGIEDVHGFARVNIGNAFVNLTMRSFNHDLVTIDGYFPVSSLLVHIRLSGDAYGNGFAHGH